MNGIHHQNDTIYSYARSDAMHDGVLVDVSAMAAEAGISVAVALTSAVYADCVSWGDADNRRQAYQDESGRLWDLLTMLTLTARYNRRRSMIMFRLYRIPRGGRGRKPRQVQLKAVIGPGDQGEPVMTVMMPHED